MQREHDYFPSPFTAFSAVNQVCYNLSTLGGNTQIYTVKYLVIFH